MFRSSACLIVVASAFLAIVVVRCAPAITENFCDPELCGKTTNIACNTVSGLQSTCPAGNATQVSTDGALKTLILDLHNKYRSQLASGKLSNYKSAAKMLQMVSRHSAFKC